MTTAQYLTMLRRRVADVDLQAALYRDTDLLLFTADTALELGAYLVMTFATVVVDASVDVAGGAEAFTPTLDAPTGTILMLATAATLLRNEYVGRLNRGELGVSWKSGLEEESSISAAQYYRDLIDEVQRQCDGLIDIQRGQQRATRPQ